MSNPAPDAPVLAAQRAPAVAPPARGALLPPGVQASVTPLPPFSQLVGPATAARGGADGSVD